MGCGAGVGGEDGRADGGAVSFLKFDGRSLRSGAMLVLLVTMSFLAACSRQKAQAAPDAANVLKAVAPADPAKFPDLQAIKHWSNPYLVIRPGAVGLLTDMTANEEQILKPEDVLKALSELPQSAWPYGRAVAILVDAKPTSSEQDKTALRRNRGIVAGELQSAHVAIDWIPSS